MCRWMGSHFHGWNDYDGVAYFLIFGVRQLFIFMASKRTIMFVLGVRSKVTMLGLQKLHTCAKVTKMGSMTGHRIDYNGVGALRGALRGQRHIPSKNWPK